MEETWKKIAELETKTVRAPVTYAGDATENVRRPGRVFAHANRFRHQRGYMVIFSNNLIISACYLFYVAGICFCFFNCIVIFFIFDDTTNMWKS